MRQFTRFAVDVCRPVVPRHNQLVGYVRQLTRFVDVHHPVTPRNNHVLSTEINFSLAQAPNCRRYMKCPVGVLLSLQSVTAHSDDHLFRFANSLTVHAALKCLSCAVRDELAIKRWWAECARDELAVSSVGGPCVIVMSWLY